MTQQRFLSVFLIASSLWSTCLADTVTLKNGEIIEGKISFESDTELTVEFKISEAITDSRIVPKSDVLSITKIQPDELAWERLKNLKPGAHSLTAASYQTATQSLHGFLEKFTTSPFAADARTAISAFEQEKARVDAGELKVNGHWFTKDEALRERYQIAASFSFESMKDQANRGDLAGALNTFDGIEKQYPGSQIYPEAVELARRVLAAFQPYLLSRLRSLKAAEAERDKAIENSSPAQKAELKAAIEKEHATDAAFLSEAERLHSKWPPLIARSEKSITAAAAKIPEETRHLGAIDVAKIRQSLEAADRSKLALSENDFAAALKFSKDAQSLWSENELAKRLQEEIKTSQAKFVAAAAEAAEEKKKIAAAEQKRLETEAAEKAAKEAEAAAAAAAAAQAAKAPPKKPSVVSLPKEKPFLLTATGASSVVALIGLLGIGISAYRKLKGRSPKSID